MPILRFSRFLRQGIHRLLRIRLVTPSTPAKKAQKSEEGQDKLAASLSENGFFLSRIMFDQSV